MERKRFRFEVLLERFFPNFHRIILTNLLFAIPSAVVFVIGYFIFRDGIHPLIALLAIIPLFPFYAGVVAVCRNIARGDEKVQTVSVYLTAVKEHFFSFLLHGVLIYIASVLSVVSISLYISKLSSSWIFYTLLFFCILIALLLLYTAFYVPLMNLSFDLPLRYVYKNSFLMSFGEFKNNLFATFALIIVFGIFFSITAITFNACGYSPVVLFILLAVFWIFLLPATFTYMYVFFIYDGMTAIMRNKEDISKDLKDSIDKSIEESKKKMAPKVEEEDFSDIDINSLKDTDDYIFHNGRMVKQSTLLRMMKEKEAQKAENCDEE